MQLLTGINRQDSLVSRVVKKINQNNVSDRTPWKLQGKIEKICNRPDDGIASLYRRVPSENENREAIDQFNRALTEMRDAVDVLENWAAKNCLSPSGERTLEMLRSNARGLGAFIADCHMEDYRRPQEPIASVASAASSSISDLKTPSPAACMRLKDRLSVISQRRQSFATFWRTEAQRD